MQTPDLHVYKLDLQPTTGHLFWWNLTQGLDNCSLTQSITVSSDVCGLLRVVVILILATRDNCRFQPRTNNYSSLWPRTCRRCHIQNNVPIRLEMNNSTNHLEMLLSQVDGSYSKSEHTSLLFNLLQDDMATSNMVSGLGNISVIIIIDGLANTGATQTRRWFL